MKFLVILPSDPNFPPIILNLEQIAILAPSGIVTSSGNNLDIALEYRQDYDAKLKAISARVAEVSSI